MRFLIATILFAAAVPAAAQVSVAVTDSGDGTRTLSHEVIIKAPIDEVWDAVATPEGWRTWAVPIVREGPDETFETSYDASQPPGGPATIQQRWIVRQKPYSASFRTIRVPAGFPHAKEYLNVISVFTLSEVSGGTRVRLRGTGYPNGASGDALLSFFKTGNTLTLQQLEARFTRGPIDWSSVKTQTEK